MPAKMGDVEHHWEHKFLAAHETRQQTPKRSSFFFFLFLEESRGESLGLLDS